MKYGGAHVVDGQKVLFLSWENLAALREVSGRGHYPWEARVILEVLHWMDARMVWLIHLQEESRLHASLAVSQAVSGREHVQAPEQVGSGRPDGLVEAPGI